MADDIDAGSPEERWQCREGTIEELTFFRWQVIRANGGENAQLPGSAKYLVATLGHPGVSHRYSVNSSSRPSGPVKPVLIVIRGTVTITVAYLVKRAQFSPPPAARHQARLADARSESGKDRQRYSKIQIRHRQSARSTHSAPLAAARRSRIGGFFVSGSFAS
jgi:hypothetical protein